MSIKGFDDADDPRMPIVRWGGGLSKDENDERDRLRLAYRDYIENHKAQQRRNTEGTT